MPVNGHSSHGSTSDAKQLEARLSDALTLCERRSAPVFTDFLTEEEQALAAAYMTRAGADYRLYGGWEDAERCMLGVFPAYEAPSAEAFPIDAVTARCRPSEKPEHRAVLGTLMSQGITRGCIGDILIEEGRCVFFCRPTVTRALVEGIDKIGGMGATLTVGCELPLPAAHGFRSITDTVASARLDCLVAALAGTGRTQAEQRIAEGLVLINGLPCKKPSQTVREGDKLTLRGEGKFIIDDISGITRKGRRILSARKYI